MAILSAIAWVVSMMGIFFLATIVFAFLGIALLVLSGLLLSVTSETGE